MADKSTDEIEKLQQIGQQVELAFQIRDDILDVTATFEQIGKTPGKNLLEEKSTYTSLLGLDGAKKQLLTNLKSAQKLLTELSVSENSEILQIIKNLEVK